MSKSVVYINHARRNSGVSQRSDQVGLVYRHTWETGFQDLVFRTHEGARKFAEANKAPYEGPASGK